MSAPNQQSDSDLSIQVTKDCVGFWIHVTPRASCEAVGSCHGDALRVAVKAPPVEGKANAACVRAIATALGLRRNCVHIEPGAKGRRKRVRIEGPAEAVAAALRKLASARKLR